MRTSKTISEYPFITSLGFERKCCSAHLISHPVPMVYGSQEIMYSILVCCFQCCSTRLLRYPVARKIRVNPCETRSSKSKKIKGLTLIGASALGMSFLIFRNLFPSLPQRIRTSIFPVLTLDTLIPTITLTLLPNFLLDLHQFPVQLILVSTTATPIPPNHQNQVP